LLKIHFNINLPSMSGSSNWSLSVRFPHQNSLSSSLPLLAMYPAHLILDLITHMIFGKEYRSLSSYLCSLLHIHVTLSRLCPIVLKTVLSNILSLYSFLNVNGYVSHPYKTAGKIIVLYILILMFVNTLKTKRSCAE
jgi:hypothetical protein